MGSKEEQWFVIPVNPYPWKVPPFTPARKGTKIFVKAGRDEGLHSYKQAVKEYIEKQPHEMIDGPVELEMWFYRNIPEYTTPQGRRARKHEADTTNLQKSTEDALQGILYANDKDVVKVSSLRVEQSPTANSLIVVRVKPYILMYPIFPEDVQFAMSNLFSSEPYKGVPNNFEPDEEIPF